MKLLPRDVLQVIEEYIPRPRWVVHTRTNVHAVYHTLDEAWEHKEFLLRYTSAWNVFLSEIPDAEGYRSTLRRMISGKKHANKQEIIDDFMNKH
jgi:hypothetical protein